LHSNNDNSLQYNSIIHKIASTLTKLILIDAFISLLELNETLKYLPLLEVLELNFVCIKTDFGLNFWQVLNLTVLSILFVI